MAALLGLCAAAHSQTWQVVLETVRPHENPDKLDRFLATTSIDSYTSSDGSPHRATLRIQCTGVLTGSATVSVDDITFRVKDDAILTLPVRLDHDPPLQVGWANLSLHQILLYDLRNLLPAHRRISIDLPLDTPSPPTLTFDLSGLASTMKDLNCRRRLP